LTNKAREIVVFEENRKKRVRELKRIKDDETVVRWTPLDKVICVLFINHVICLHNERCDYVVLLHPHLIKNHSQHNTYKDRIVDFVIL
jgi:hypothetical protein